MLLLVGGVIIYYGFLFTSFYYLVNPKKDEKLEKIKSIN